MEFVRIGSGNSGNDLSLKCETHTVPVIHRNKTMHVYEIWPRSDKRGFDLISDVLPFGRLWYAEPNTVERRRLSI